MSNIGQVEGLWRYPVKSMRGEQVREAFAGFGGFYGDRWYAIATSGGVKGFPYLTAREKQTMLLHTPVYRHPDRMKQPPNLAEAQALEPGITPIYCDADDALLDVRTPSGETLAIDDPKLIESLREGLPEKHELHLMRSQRALTDCRPISLISNQTARQLDADPRRFRANIYLDLADGFAEDAYVGKMLRIGSQVIVAVVERDPRCKMITLDPDTGDANPELMRLLAKEHESKAGVYAAVVVEGIVWAGDPVTLLA